MRSPPETVASYSQVNEGHLGKWETFPTQLLNQLVRRSLPSKDAHETMAEKYSATASYPAKIEGYPLPEVYGFVMRNDSVSLENYSVFFRTGKL